MNSDAVALRRKAEMIANSLSVDALSPLLSRDGTTFRAPFINNGKATSSPSWMLALGLVEGAPGPHVSGFDWAEWLTPLGQAVVDEIKVSLKEAD